MADRADRLRAVRARHRRTLAAHPRRLFHHDHARLRADDLLRRRQPRPLRRRRRPDHLQAQRFRRADQSLRQDHLLLRLLRVPDRHLLPGLAHRQFALRHGDPGRALQRTAYARDRLSNLPLSADLLRDRGRAVRTCRYPARQSDRLRQPGHDALDPIGRPDRDGGARRHGIGAGARDRRGRATGPGGDAARHDRRGRTVHHRQAGGGGQGILGADPRSDAAAGRAVRAWRHRRIAGEDPP